MVNFDSLKSINGHSINFGWLLESLRQNDKTFKKIHGQRKIKEVSFSFIFVNP